MEAVVGLLVMILGVSYGVDTHCDGRQDGAQCYGALGGAVAIQLMDNALEINVYRWLKENTVILDGRGDIVVSDLKETRFFFTPSNGTFKINKLNRTDGGEYKLETFDINGQKTEKKLQLTIQAPVSSVLLVRECLSQGEMKVSCFSEGGDSPQYSWTLNGHTLTDAELLSGNTETNSITLKQHVSGQLVCSVRNNVNSVSVKEIISNCGYIYINCTSPNGTHISQWVFAANNTLECIEPTPATTMITETSPAGKETGITVSISPSTNITSSNQNVTSLLRDDPWYINYWPIMAGVLSALVLLLVVGVAVIIHTQKKKKGGKAEEDDQELTYADVRIMQRPGRQVQQQLETEVEYGQVRFSERPQQSAERAGDECVYAKVRKVR